jgi:hypothetical protein
MDFSVVAKANTCVDYIHFQLLGPGGFTMTRTETNIPFTLFGDEITTLYSKRLSVIGNYTLTMIPDQNMTKAKIINFTCFFRI